MNGCVRVAGFDPSTAREPLNRWILGEAAKAAAETAGAIESYRFNDAANAVYRFVWSVFCDWHLELAKPVLQGAGRRRRQGRDAGDDRPCARHDLRAPASVHAVPHRGAVGDQGRSRARRARARWRSGPGRSEGFEVDEAVEAEIGWVVDLIAEIRSVRSEMGVPPSTLTPLVLVAPERAGGAEARAPGARASGASPGSDRSRPPRPRRRARCISSCAARRSRCRSPASSISTPRRRVSTGRSPRCKLEIAKVEAKLGNDDFVARAPEDVIAEHQERLETFQARLVKLTDARERLERV